MWFLTLLLPILLLGWVVYWLRLRINVLENDMQAIYMVECERQHPKMKGGDRVTYEEKEWVIVGDVDWVVDDGTIHWLYNIALVEDMEKVEQVMDSEVTKINKKKIGFK